MEITKKTIILAVISVILIAIILSGIFYLLKNSKQLIPTGSKSTNPLAKLGVITNNSTPTPIKSGPTPTQSGSTPVVNNNTALPVANTQVVASNGTKSYQGSNFVIKYPQNWGILTCSNSQNIELDPYNFSDTKNYACDRAIKPITVLVSNNVLNCSGETVKIGNNVAIKSKTETANWLKNRWCVNKNGMSFDITNRVAPSGIGTGKNDFSTEIEKIVSFL